MTQIDQLRALIQDVVVRQSQQSTIDGLATTLQLNIYPISATSVIITGSGVVPSFTVDSALGVVTFSSTPVAQDLSITYGAVLLTDDALQSYLDLEVDSADQIRLAAADALDAMASNQALIQKKIRLLDLQTDGPAVAESLHKHADMLRQQVFNDEYQESTFDWAEGINTQADWKEKVVKDWMRGT